MWHRTKAMAYKEFLQIIRDFRTLYLAVIMPLLLILFFGYAINFDIDHIRLGVFDADRSPLSREILQKVEAGNWFEITYYSESRKELIEQMDKGQIDLALFLPVNLERHIKRNENATIQTVLDGSNNNTATIAQGYMAIFLESLQMKLLEDYKKDYPIEVGSQIEIQPLVLYNPELKSRYSTLPGLIVIIMAILAALLTSTSVAREWERGTMEALIATPVRSHEIIIGKLIPYTAISVAQAIITVPLAVFVFDVPFRGSPIVLLLTSFLFSIGALGLGLLFSTVLKSQLPAMQVAILGSMLPSILLSDFVFPIDSMPPVIRVITHIVPARYFLEMLRTMFLKGSGFEAFYLETFFLFLFGFGVCTIASIRLKRKVA